MVQDGEPGGVPGDGEGVPGEEGEPFTHRLPHSSRTTGALHGGMYP